MATAAAHSEWEYLLGTGATKKPIKDILPLSGPWHISAELLSMATHGAFLLCLDVCCIKEYALSSTLILASHPRDLHPYNLIMCVLM